MTRDEQRRVMIALYAAALIGAAAQSVSMTWPDIAWPVSLASLMFVVILGRYVAR